MRRVRRRAIPNPHPPGEPDGSMAPKESHMGDLDVPIVEIRSDPPGAAPGRLAALLGAAALASPAAAFAHATLLRTEPADGTVLASAPRQVTVFFDDRVRVGQGNAAIANDSGRSVLSGQPVARGHTLVLPIRRRLANGDYSIRWSIVSDDGHPERGVLAFGVGAGRAPPPA